MSFILDALKKLEREKKAREPGVVMVGPVPWGGVDRGRRVRTLVLATAAVVAVLAGMLWWLRARPVTTPRGDRGAATAEPGTPASTAGPAGTESTRPSVHEDAGPTAVPPGRDATLAEPAPAPPPRALDLPRAEPATTARTLSEPSAPGEAALTVTAEPAEELAEPPAPAETPSEENVAPQPDFRLTAISTHDGEPIALLNDRLVREGDSFGGVRVLRIGTTEVEIEVNGERRTIGF